MSEPVRKAILVSSSWACGCDDCHGYVATESKETLTLSRDYDNYKVMRDFPVGDLVIVELLEERVGLAPIWKLVRT